MREIILDTETTGLDPFTGHRIVEIGCIELIERNLTGNQFHCYINPCRDVPKEAYDVHGISSEFLLDKPLFADIATDFLSFIKDAKLIIHNAPFDMKFLNYELSLLKLSPLDNIVVDTLKLARKRFPGAAASLDALCKRFNIDLSSRNKHGALIDSELLAYVYISLIGGDFAQQKIQLDSDNNLINLSKITKACFPHRKFNISSEEELLHQEMLAKIKNSLWDKQES